ncbi:MAG: hypothetical protein A2Y40_02115 [Candidatus Margulisbacteria bacterium GWF2_35_9]|nr:MAG: hypothetical protein A2Y40_02115 [Candidatus Margulisbacteria bacterium GWF2_35_9]
MKQIPHNKPTLSNEEKVSVARVLESGYISYGKVGKEAESALSEFIGLGIQSRLVNSGTTALYLALLWLKEEYQIEKVLIPTYTCTAVLNAIMMADLKAVVLDVDNQLNLSIDTVMPYYDSKSLVILTNTFGYPADIEKFVDKGILFVEDNAQSIGAKYLSREVGNFGIISTYSFYATKPITSGYGGAVCSKQESFIRWVDDYINFDMPKTYKPRFNFLLSDINSAVLLEQIKKYPLLLAKRKQIVAKYQNAFGNNVLDSASDTKIPNYYRIMLKVNNAGLYVQKLRDKGIQVIQPLLREELLHVYLNLPISHFKQAESNINQYISLPAYPSLTSEDIQYIIENIGGLL